MHFGMGWVEKRISKSSKNPGVKQRCALVFSFGRGGGGMDERKGPAQDFTEFCGLGSRVAGKERRR